MGSLKGPVCAPQEDRCFWYPSPTYPTSLYVFTTETGNLLETGACALSEWQHSHPRDWSVAFLTALEGFSLLCWNSQQASQIRSHVLRFYLPDIVALPALSTVPHRRHRLANPSCSASAQGVTAWTTEVGREPCDPLNRPLLKFLH